MSLQRLLLILRARFWVVLFTFIVTVATTVIVSSIMPKTYTAATSLVIDFKSGDSMGGGSPLPPQLLPGYMATQTGIIASRNVAVKVVDNLQLDKAPEAREQFEQATEGKGSIRDWLADALLNDLQVEPSPESSMITLNYSSTDPRFSAAVANAFAQGYIQTNLELRVEPARQATKWFGEQIKTLRGNLERAQANLSTYQQQKGIVATDERLDIENARLAELSSQLVVAQTQAQDTQSRQNQAESPDMARSLETLPEILANPYIQNLKSELAKQESKLAELSGVGKNHPQYQRASAEVNSMRAKIDREIIKASSGIVNNAQLATKREAALKTSLAVQKAKVLELKKQRDDIAVFLREVENAQNAYDEAMKRYNQSNMESQLTHTNVAVLSPAIEPVAPSSPKLLLNIMLAVFFGGLLGVGLALLVEMSRRYIRSEEDISADLNLPVLGVLGRKHAYLKNKKQPRRLGYNAAGLRAA